HVADALRNGSGRCGMCLGSARRDGTRPLPGFRQPAAHVRHELGVSGLYPIPDHLGGGPTEGDVVVRASRTNELALVELDGVDVAVRCTLLAPAATGRQANAAIPRPDRLGTPRRAIA